MFQRFSEPRAPRSLLHRTADTPHMALELLRVEECSAAKLCKYGMDCEGYRIDLAA